MNMINWSVLHLHLNCKHVDFLYSQEGKVEADRKEVDRMTVKEIAH